MFKNLSYQYKLFFSFSIIIFIILIVSATSFYYFASSLAKSNIDETQRNITAVIEQQLDGMIFDMNDFTKQANSSSVIINSLQQISNSNDNYFDRDPRVKDNVMNMLYSFTSSQPIQGRISIISRYYDYTDLSNTYKNLIISKDEIKNINRISSLMNTDMYYTVSPPHQDEWTSGNDIVISLDRPLRDNFHIYGVIQINKSIKEIDKICTNQDTGNAYLTALFDKSGKMIYNNFPDTETTGQYLYNEQIQKNKTGNYMVKNAKGQILYTANYLKLDNVDWTIVEFKNFYSYNEPILFLRNMIILIFVLALFVIMIFLYIFTGTITKPIRNIIKSLDTVNIRSNNIQIARETTNNEITLLSKSIQELLEKIQITTKSMIESDEREIKAHLLVLQSQINPHFLYNTLAVIGAYGQNDGKNIVSHMCSELGSLLRYTINTNDSRTTIKDELKMANSYLYLMGMRYQTFLKYNVVCDPEMENIIVPKLIVQPLVENCFKHGFTDVEPIWELTVKGYLQDNFWMIKVMDNGKGLSCEEIDELYKRIQEAKVALKTSGGSVAQDNSSGGIGLVNTIMRLHIFYSGSEYFKIEQDKVTSIIIGGPMDEQKI